MDSKQWVDGPFPLVPTSKSLKREGDPIAIWLGDEMADAHNVMIRQLNSIYLQAPHVKLEADKLDLCQYAVFWKDFLHHHHTLEETWFFPDIERITGEKGIMDRNVHEHEAFTPGLDAFGKYAQDCIDKTESFDITRFMSLIDSFAPALAAHLKDEIETLVSLGKYSPVLQELKKAYLVLTAEAQKQDKKTVMPLVCGARDVTYEGGNSWPGFPFFVPYMVDYIFAGKYRSVWRFNPSTMTGQPRPLHFLAEGTSK